MNGRGPGLLLLPGALALLFAACSTSDTSSSGTGVQTPGTPSLTIVSPAPGACVVVPKGADPRISLQLATTNLFIRPPGACSLVSLDKCGHVIVKVNGFENNVGASEIVDVLLRKLGDRTDKLSIEVSVVDDEGQPVHQSPSGSDSGPQVAQTIEIHTEDDCGTGSGGSGTTTSTTTTTGSGSGGGMGGMGGGGAGGATTTTTGAGGAGGAGGSAGAGG